MQAELTALQPQLVKTVAEVEELMARIAHEKKHEVEPKAAVVAEEEAKAKEAAACARAIKDECEAELSEAMPILRDALAALDTIKEADISYIKKLGNPPGAIKLVMEAVCVILDVKPVKVGVLMGLIGCTLDMLDCIADASKLCTFNWSTYIYRTQTQK